MDFIKNKTILKILSMFLATCIFLGFSYSLVLLILTRLYPKKYETEVYESCNRYNLDEFLVFSVIKTESDFDKNAVSKVGAIGLMQIKTETGEYIAKLLDISEFDLFEPKTNIEFGCKYLRYLIDKFSDVNTVLCAYNAGEGKVTEWLKNPEYSSDGKHLIAVPFAETRGYIKKVNKSFKIYKKLYNNILDKK